MPTENKKMRIIVPAALLAVILLTIFNSYYCHYHVLLTSDHTTTLPMAQDIIAGNVLLKGWTLGTNNFYFTETIFFALLDVLGIPISYVVDLLPAFFYSLLVVLLALFSLMPITDKKEPDKEEGFLYRPSVLQCVFLFTGIIAFLGIVSPLVSVTLLRPNSHNNLYVFILISLTLLLHWMRTEKHTSLVVFIAVAALLSFSESVTTMVLFAPLVVFACFELLNKEHRLKAAVLLVSVFIAYLLGKVINTAVVALGGMTTLGMPIGRTGLSQLPSRVVMLFQQACLLFGVETIGFSFSGIASLLSFVVMLLCGMSIICNCMVSRKLPVIDRLFVIIAAVNLLATLFTNVPVHHRYIAPAFLFGFILFMRSCIRLQMKLKDTTTDQLIYKKASTIFCSVALAAFVFVAAARLYEIASVPNHGSAEKDLIAAVEENSFGDGYGDYWSTSICSFYSGFQTEVYPIVAHNDTLTPYSELVKDSWYLETDKHFIVTPSDNDGLFVYNTDMIDVLGQPDKTYSNEKYNLFYWKKDIAPYLKK